MLPSLKSIYWRILSSFIIIIFFTVILSIVIAYISTKSELPRLLIELRTENIAQTLSSAYTRDQSWEMLKKEILRINPAETYSLRVVVKDDHGKTLYNSFSDLVHRNNSPLIEGDTIEISDFNTDRVVGSVTVYINKEFLDRETGEYILSIVKPRILQGLITMVIAIFAASLLSGRITTPIIALTRATRDISQRKDSTLLPVHSSDELGQMSNSFNQMIRSLGVQRELRKRLISDVSHEINTPLNVISLEAKGLLDGLISSDEAAVRIIGEIDKLSSLIHDLDWLAETDSGEFKLKLEKYPIRKIVENEVGRWQMKAQVEGITLEMVAFSGTLPDISVDLVRISQILGNLIENSIKYVQMGGTVTVACAARGDEVVISVKDTGQGIAAEEIPFIFERFYRADQLQNAQKAGRGLGLAIAKQIVELHRGRIWVESEIGIGSCFSFSLPL